MVPEGEELLVLDEAEGWVKVDVEEGTGWVSTDYISLHSEFVQAESREEEAARLAKEEEERKKAREAAAAKAAASAPAQQAAATTTETYAVGEGSEIGVSVAEYALQFVGNPYVYGGHQPDKRCGLFRICYERLRKLWCKPASFLRFLTVPRCSGRWSGKCTARRFDLLFRSCGSVYRKRTDCSRFQ